MLNEIVHHKNIILASGSPRRQQFFKDLAIPFTIRLKEIEEVYPNHLKAEEITNYLAELKANAFENELAQNDVLVNQKILPMPLRCYKNYRIKPTKSLRRFV